MASRVALRRWGTWIAPVAIAALVVAYLARERLPRVIRVASATSGGLYYRLAQTVGAHLESDTDRGVEVLETEGSAQNRALLIDGGAELAILQSGAVSMPGLAVLAPLYDDVVHVIVRADLDPPARSIGDLAGRAVALGPAGSGMRRSALRVLAHYRIDPAGLRADESYFLELRERDELEAAIVTTGFLNPDLEALLETGRFRLLPLRDARAFCLRNPDFAPLEIPRGLYAEGPAVPEEPVPTVATKAVLAARADVGETLVAAAMRAVYEHDLRAEIPTLLPAADAAAWRQLPLHPVARRYFDPYGGIDLLANLMESLAAVKELLFALGAGMYLVWNRSRRRREREHDALVVAMKERLDALLDETARIERAQMETSDRAQLEAYMDEVTRIKLRAIAELTHEDLRGDRMFLIFLLQCGNLSEAIRARLTGGARA